jgi:hypothetical protein
MKISELPPEIRELVLLRQKNVPIKHQLKIPNIYLKLLNGEKTKRRLPILV